MKKLLDIMAKLRDPKTGCAWDVEQTFESLTPFVVEEAYEVVDAIHSRDMENLKEELGDLLLQIAFHSQIATEKGLFTFDDIVDGISDKMIRRHPHVFEKQESKTSAQQTKDWEKMKEQERGKKDESILKKMNAAFPATLQAEKLQHAASNAGFEWEDTKTAIQKIREELDELEAVIDQGGAEAADEYGDVLFSIIRVATMLKIPTEVALRKTNLKFIKRFQKMEALAKDQSRDLNSLSLNEWLVLWRQVKSSD